MTNPIGTAIQNPGISPELASPANPRAHGLDALRGTAILLMVLAGAIPWGQLPAWMYHAQNPPPYHALDTSIPGITWVDLVFPFFIFAMGTAFPLALGRRIAAGHAQWKITADILHRGFLLGFFAIFHQHAIPNVIDPDRGAAALLTGIASFVLMFAVFMQFPRTWKPAVRWGVRIAGWLAVILLLSTVRYPDGSGFALGRSNIILVVLTNLAVFGSLLWLLARGKVYPLLAAMAVVLAARFGAQEEGWVQWLWTYSPAPWIYQMRYLQYALVLIPGILVGNLVWHWMNRPQTGQPLTEEWSRLRWLLLALLMFAGSILLLVGLQERWLWQTNLLAAAFAGGALFLTARPSGPTGALLRQLLLWGLFWLLLGLVFEPYEEGVKKSPATISYYFVSAALASFLMVGFITIIDVLKKGRWLRLAIDNGQNPMIAYVGYGLFILPVLTLTGLHEWIAGITQNPWLGTLRGIAYTLLLALAVQFLTRRKIFWRT